MNSINDFLRKLLGSPDLSTRLRSLRVRDDIVQAAEKAAFGRQGDRDLPALESLLDADERVLQLLEGRHRTGLGLLVLTTNRVVFAPAGGSAAPTVLNRVDIQSSESRMHRGLGVVTLTVSSPPSPPTSNSPSPELDLDLDLGFRGRPDPG